MTVEDEEPAGLIELLEGRRGRSLGERTGMPDDVDGRLDGPVGEVGE